MSEETLTHVGDYEVLGVLGAGGMGKVYKVRNVISDRVEAMKVLLPNLADRRELGDRFLREIKVLAGLSHPNIASLRTALTWENQLVMIMEYVEGETLAARVKRGLLTPSDAIDYVSQVLSALGYAHSLHIIHRDIKPANMMLTPAGVVKLMDFGIARSQSDPVLTAAGSTLGSVQYMSPEQVKGEPVDERSDIYSVGVSLYEMVTGQLPFKAENEYAVMAAHLQKAPTPPSTLRDGLPPGLSEIIVMAMDKNPAQRFQSADAFRNALQSLRVAPERAAAIQAPADNDVTSIAETPPGAVISAAVLGSTAQPPPSPAIGQSMPMPPPSASSQAASISAQPSASIGQQSVEVAKGSAPPLGHQTPAPSSTPGPISSGAHRGLYIALGSFIVLVVLFAAGLYIPRRGRIHAGVNQAKSSAAVTPPMPATADKNSLSISGSVQQPRPVAPQESPASVEHNNAIENHNTAIRHTIATGDQERNHRTAKHQLPAENTQEQRASIHAPAANVPSSASAEQLQELEHDSELLVSRAEAVDESLNGIRQSQAAQGLSLRGDVAASQQRMRTYVAHIQTALKNHDADAARKYLGLAENEVTGLEKFLGR